MSEFRSLCSLQAVSRPPGFQPSSPSLARSTHSLHLYARSLPHSLITFAHYTLSHSIPTPSTIHSLLPLVTSQWMV